MKNFKKILIILDSDVSSQDCGFINGIELAQAHAIPVTLCSVVKPFNPLIANIVDFPSIDEINQSLLKQRKDELKQIADSVGSNQLDISINAMLGTSFIEVIRHVVTEGIDLVIKTVDKKTMGFASSGFHLMRKCPAPVWLVRPERKPANTILAAVDLTMEASEEGRRHNRKILNIAQELSELKSAELEVLSCWWFEGESMLRDGAFSRIPEEKLNAMLKREQDAYAEVQNDLVKDFGSDNIKQVLIKGDPKKIIPEYVNTNHIDTTVMGTIGRSGVKGLLIGNTSESVLHNIESSALTLKLEGFQSPVL